MGGDDVTVGGIEACDEMGEGVLAVVPDEEAVLVEALGEEVTQIR